MKQILTAKFSQTEIKQRLVNNMRCCKNYCNENLTSSWLHRLLLSQNPYKDFHFLYFLFFITSFYHKSICHCFPPPLILFFFSFLTPVATVTTRPSSPRCPCQTHHAHESLTPSLWCPSQPPPRATTGAEGEVSQWPSTSHSAQPTATALNMDTLSECPSESMFVCVLEYFVDVVFVWE